MGAVDVGVGRHHDLVVPSVVEIELVVDAGSYCGGQPFIPLRQPGYSRDGRAELPLPLGHHDRRQAVADDVRHRARHVHQRVDAEDQRDAFERQVVAGERAGRITSDARGTPATPLLVSISVSSIVICWPNVSCTPAACATKTDASDR